MEQDIKVVLDNLSKEWANDAINDKKMIAILKGENESLKNKIKELKEGKNEEE